MSLVRSGDHICCLFESNEEHLSIAARYIAEGLRQREHCLYSGASPAILRQFRERLADEGVDLEEMVQRGALTLATAAETHLAADHFDSERMLRMLSEKLETVMNAGFTGLRTCGDMSWLLDAPLGSEHVVIYEAMCTQFFQNSRAVGMCMYDRARLPSGLIDHALTTHPRLFAKGRCEPNHRDRSRHIIDRHRTSAAVQGTGGTVSPS
jgi:hypothetical protein